MSIRRQKRALIHIISDHDKGGEGPLATTQMKEQGNK